MTGSSALPKRAQRLEHARSAYLRSASEQAIDWYPWGPEPFARAKELGRPILLDIGAVWCHWCHVMDEGTYTDAEVARLLHERFIAVKVDRDEHPEVDRRYQQQVGALTGEGGWPLTGFLTPDGETFLGGTYFPPEDHHGRPGLRRILAEVDRVFRTEPEKVRENTSALSAALARMRSGAEHLHPTRPAADLVEQVRERLATSYDPANGGFGLAPKFPHPTAVSFLLWDSFSSGLPGPAARARETLRRMSDGGMHDQIGGGFHRYSVDEAWHIPHFEKMGIDNAALLAVYEEGFRRFGEPWLARTAADTARWVREVLEDPSGGYGTSQDADNAPGDDGRYFTWSRKEVDAVLDPEESRLARRCFGVGEDGRMPHDPDRNVLYRALPVAEVAERLGLPEADAERRLAGSTAKLAAARARRPTPFIDRARYASINGPMIGAMARASRTLGDPALLGSARRSADAFLGEGFDPERGVPHLLAPDGGTGFGRLEDNAAFALGLIELAGATALPRYVETAARLLELVTREFRSDSGLLRDLAPRIYEGPRIGPIDTPSYPLEDNPNLSPNAAVALARIRLSSLVEGPGSGVHLDAARALLASIEPRLEGAGLFAAGSALARGLLDTPPARVVIEGSGSAAEALARVAETTWHPNLWVFRGVPPAPFSLPEELAAAAREGSKARALLCFGTRCGPPITDPERLSVALRDAGRSPA